VAQWVDQAVITCCQLAVVSLWQRLQTALPFRKYDIGAVFGMKSAIVTGASGRLGSALVSRLAEEGVPTLSIGRLPLGSDTLVEAERRSECVTHVRLASAAFGDPDFLAANVPWKPAGECVLFHLAWGVGGQLATPDVPLQVASAAAISDAVNMAAVFECTKLVNAGSQQERFVQDYLVDRWPEVAYPTNQGIYGAAKLIARDLGSILCYIKKIDFVNVRFSTYVTPSLDGAGYIASVLRAIRDRRGYESLRSRQWTEILPIEEVARAFAMIGAQGKNKADYYIGTNRPRTLAELFRYFELVLDGSMTPESAWISAPLSVEDRYHFDPEPLRREVGFELRETFETLAAEVARR